MAEFFQSRIKGREYFDSSLAANMPRSFAETIEASFDLARQDTATGAIDRLQTLDELKHRGGEKVSAQKLNQLYPHMPEPFTEDMTADAAEEIVSRNAERARLGSIIENGPDGFLPGTAQFLTGMAAQVLDPIEFGAGLLIGGGMGMVAKRASSASRLARLYSKSATGYQVIGREVMEGAAANIVVEPLISHANKQELQDYTAVQSLSNVAIGAIGFPVAKFALGKAVRFARDVGFSFAKDNLNVAMGRLLNDRKPNNHVITQALVRETDGSFPKGEVIAGRTGYEFRALDESHPKKFFAASQKQASEFNPRDSVRIEEDFGDGVTLTDNPVVANNYAARSVSKNVGEIAEVDLSGKKLLNLDQPFNDALRKKISKIVKDLDLERPAKEVLDEIRNRERTGETQFKAVIDEIKGEKNDGVHYQGGKFLDVENSPHNVVHLFNDDIKPIERYKADRKHLNRLSDQDVENVKKDYTSEDSKLFHDGERAREFDEIAAQKSEDKINDLKQREEESVLGLEDLEKQGLLDERGQSVLKQLQEEAPLAEKIGSAIKAAMVCVRSGA